MRKQGMGVKKALLGLIFFSIVLSATLSTFLITLNFYLDYKKSLKENALKAGEKIKTDIEKLYSLGLSLKDMAGLGQEGKQMTHEESNLSYIIITDKDNTVSVATIDGYKDRKFAYGDGEDVDVDNLDSLNVVLGLLDNEKKPVGRIHVGLKKALLRQKIYNTFIIFLVANIGVVLFIFAIAKTFIENRLITPLMKLKEGTEKVAEGDLSLVIQTAHSDEVGEVTENFTRMVGEIRDIVVHLKDGTRQLVSVGDVTEDLSHKVKSGSQRQFKNVSDVINVFKNIEDRVVMLRGKVSALNDFIELTASTFLEISSSSDEIFRTMDELLKSVEKVDDAYKNINKINAKLDEGAESLSKEVENILSFVTEMDAAIKTTLMVVTETSKVADKMELLAKDSRVALQDTIKSVDRIAELSVDSKNSFDTLKNSIGKVSKILNVIEDITDQTNLLALNAAIIAAQNQSGGKAFSVVADEIKELSRRTQTSTKEIAELITVITGQTEKVFCIIEESAANGEVAVGHSREIEAKIGEILKFIAQIALSVKDIVRAANEQSQGSSTVRRETEELKSISADLIKLKDEGNKGSKGLGEMVDFISGVAGKVVSSIKEENEAIGNVKKSIIDLSGFTVEMVGHMDKEVQEFNDATPVLLDIKQLADENSRGSSTLEDQLVELKNQIVKFNELTKRFSV